MIRKLKQQIAAPDQAIATLGERLAQLRLSRNQTQAALALEAGISVSTLKRLEQGDNPTLDSLVRVMSALGIAENLALLVPVFGVRPLELAAAKGKRQRARQSNAAGKSSGTWTWKTP